MLEEQLPIDVLQLRKRFPTLAHKTYLNSGSYGLLSIDGRKAFEEYLSARERRGASWDDWLGRAEEVRAHLARLLNAEADEIAITASASAGINALASTLDFSGRRNKIVVSDFEFPTSGQIWHAQERRGASIEHVPEDSDGTIPIKNFERAIDERTALVVVSHVCYRTGAKLDVAPIARLAHERGALLLLDCYQSVGVTDIDVKTLHVDVLVGGTMKYLLGTAGIGFLYVRSDLVEVLTPLTTGWFAQADPSAMDIYRNIPAPTARRFQAGTPPVVNCYAALAGLRIILSLGTDRIEAYVRALTARCMDRLVDMGCTLATPRSDAHRGPMIGIRSRDENALVTALANRDVVTSCRAGAVRAMFHCYNNEDDIEALLSALAASKALLR